MPLSAPLTLHHTHQSRIAGSFVFLFFFSGFLFFMRLRFLHLRYLNPHPYPLFTTGSASLTSFEALLNLLRRLLFYYLVHTLLLNIAVSYTTVIPRSFLYPIFLFFSYLSFSSASFPSLLSLSLSFLITIVQGTLRLKLYIFNCIAFVDWGRENGNLGLSFYICVCAVWCVCVSLCSFRSLLLVLS